MYAQGDDASGGPGGLALEWSALVPGLIHSTKVLIIEAMDWIGHPLSATQLETIFGGALSQSIISYHLNSLAKAGALELARRVPVRGTGENFYYFTEEVKPQCG